MLDLRERSLNGLRKIGIRYIHELVRLSIDELFSVPNLGRKSVMDIKDSVSSVGLQLGMTIQTCETPAEEFDNSDDTKFWLSQPIVKMGMRVRSSNGLQQSGVTYVHQLVQLNEQEILSMPNLGRDSVKDIVDSLSSVGLTLEMRVEHTQEDTINVFGGASDSIKIIEPQSPPNGLDKINVSQLGFSVRTTNCLNSAGIRNALELVSMHRSDFAKIGNMGKKSIGEIATIVDALCLARDSDENFSLNSYARNSDFITLIPEHYSEQRPSDFINAIHGFFDEFCSTLESRANYIARTRIWPKDGRVKTLEELGGKFDVTRERVRQIEMKVVKKLAGILCEGGAIRQKKDKAVFICDPEFSKKWLRAVDVFRGIDETDTHTFATALCQVWDVDMRSLEAVFPLTVVAFTRSTTTELSRDFRRDSRISMPLEFSSEGTKSLKLSSFRIGRHSRTLSKSGIVTVRDVHDEWPLSDSNAVKNMVSLLADAEQYLDNAGDLDWQTYLQSLGIKSLPSEPPTTPEQFFLNFNQFIAEALPNLCSWKNTKAVFQNRTKYNASTRMTLSECADEIFGKPNFGPHVARIEKYLLERLSDIFLYHDFSNAKFWIPGQILHYMKECQGQYERSTLDYDVFCQLLRGHFSLPTTTVQCSAPAIWGILNGLPPDRYFHLRKRNLKQPKEPAKLGQKIKLVGFRSVH